MYKRQIEYTLEKTTEIPWDRDSMEAVVPPSHGNLNYVYRVWDGKGHSIYIKQAGSEARISKDIKPSRDRNRLESEILMLEDQYAPGMVPHVYFFDTVMCACGMEDCSDYAVMRDAMLKHETFPRFAEDVSTFMAVSYTHLDVYKRQGLRDRVFLIMPDVSHWSVPPAFP